MNTPNIITIDSAVKSAGETSTEIAPGKWVPCRSLGMQGLMLRRRFKAAFMVFTGRADALVYPGQEKISI